MKLNHIVEKQTKVRTTGDLKLPYLTLKIWMALNSYATEHYKDCKKIVSDLQTQ